MNGIRTKFSPRNAVVPNQQWRKVRIILLIIIHLGIFKKIYISFTVHVDVVNQEHPGAVSGPFNYFKCRNCGAGYSQKCDLNQHKKNCYLLKKFPCKLCGTPGYSDPNDLRAHLVRCHNIHPSKVAPYGIKPTFPCDLCSYRALSLANFKKQITEKSKIILQ